MFMLPSRDGPYMFYKLFREFRFCELFFISYLIVGWINCFELLCESRCCPAPFDVAIEAPLNFNLWSLFLAVFRPLLVVTVPPIPAYFKWWALIMPPPPPCSIIKLPWLIRSFSVATLSLPEVEVRSVAPAVGLYCIFIPNWSLFLFELCGLDVCYLVVCTKGY